MNKPILSRYRVDNIPHVLKPVFYLFGYGMGTIRFFFTLILRITIKVEITGQENLKEHSNHIFCHWHSYVPLATLCAVPNISGSRPWLLCLYATSQLVYEAMSCFA